MVPNRDSQTVGHASVIVADEKLILLNDMGDVNWMGLRPEHTLQAPTARWLWSWWCATGGSIAVPTVAVVLIRRFRPRINWRAWFTAIGFLTCLLAGPLLSRSLGDFIFTWPGCLFLAFQSTIYSADFRRQDHVRTTGLNRFVGFAFLATCCVYFLVCRRESLVTEWVFLCAFIAVIPTSLAGRFVSNRKGLVNRLFEAGCFVASFTAYFFGAAAILWWQYGLPWS